MRDELKKALDEACECNIDSVQSPNGHPGMYDFISVDSHVAILAGRDRVIAKLIEQRGAWRDKCDGYAMHWRAEVSDHQDAELIEALKEGTP